jgi:hypothetical protein
VQENKESTVKVTLVAVVDIANHFTTRGQVHGHDVHAQLTDKEGVALRAEV